MKELRVKRFPTEIMYYIEDSGFCSEEDIYKYAEKNGFAGETNVAVSCNPGDSEVFRDASRVANNIEAILRRKVSLVR